MFVKVMKLEKDKYYSGSDEWTYKEVPTLINTANIECVCASEKDTCAILFTSGFKMHVNVTLDCMTQILWSDSAMDCKEG